MNDNNNKLIWHKAAQHVRGGVKPQTFSRSYLGSTWGSKTPNFVKEQDLAPRGEKMSGT